MDLFSFIKQNVDIIDVVSEYTHLKKTGSMYWKAPCPFHHEKTPSFTVTPHKSIYYCFGCSQGGDVINFIERIEHLSAFEATQHLIDRYNLNIPEDLLQNSSHTPSKNSVDLCTTVAQWCNNKLLKSIIAKKYLSQRQFTHEAISQFMIGYFPSGAQAMQDLISHISLHGFTSKDLLHENIVFQGRGNLYSPFEDRIVFPIKDHLGRICGFGGRIVKQDDNRPKYYNSKETTSFKKSHILFGFDLAKQNMQKNKSVFLVEGYTDCVAMYQHGFKNTVATLGTACNLDHLKQLARYVQTIYLLYDGDNAGKQAILRFTQFCWQLDLEFKVICLPAGQDPASLLEQNQSLEPFITQAPDIFSFFLQTSGKSFKQQSLKEKVACTQDILQLINNISDPLKKNILLNKASEILQIPSEILKKEYTKASSTSTNSTVQTSNQDTIRAQHSKLEEEIVAIILQDPSVITTQDEILLLAGLPKKICSIIEHIRSLKLDTNSTNIPLEQLVTPAQLNYAQQIVSRFATSDTKRTFQQLMIHFQKKHWKSIASHIKLKLVQAQKEQNIPEVKKLLDAFENIKKKLVKNGRL